MSTQKPLPSALRQVSTNRSVPTADHAPRINVHASTPQVDPDEYDEDEERAINSPSASLRARVVHIQRELGLSDPEVHFAARLLHQHDTGAVSGAVML